MIGTKEATKIPFLDEQLLEDLRGSNIPLKMDVFRFFFFLHFVNGLPLKDASQQVVSKTKEFWEQGGIKTKYDGCSEDDIIKMWKVYKVTEILKMIVAVTLYYFFTFGHIDRWA